MKFHLLKAIKKTNGFYFHNNFSTTKSSPQYNILFFGTNNFSVESLKALINEKNNSNSFVKSIEVVIPPEHKTGRGFKNLTKCPVKLFAEKHSLIIHEAPLKALFKDWRVPKPNDNLSSQFDIGVVVSFGYFLTPSILDSFLNGSINVHASLLPKYRGASPIQYAILNGDEETGVTIQELDYRIFDAGRIIRSIKIPIPFNSTYLILENILASKGAELLIDTLSNYDHYKRLASDQDASKVSKAPKITKVMSEIKWNQMSSLQLDRLYRAISHQYPLTTKFQGKKIQLHNISLPTISEYETIYKQIESLNINDPGTIIICDQPKNKSTSSPLSNVYVLCSDNKFILCKSVKMEKKNELLIKDWINGYGVISGMKFDD